jgi:shikimate kinase
MMGSGKTETGRELARLSGREFVDLDEEIERKARRSINEIFREKGESYFRVLEKELLGQVSGKSNQVVATGGGVVLDGENRQKMKETGIAIYLEASLETLWQRVQDKTDRPLLYVDNPKATLQQLGQIRAPLYRMASGGHSVATDGLTPKGVAEKIYQEFLK